MIWRILKQAINLPYVVLEFDVIYLASPFDKVKTRLTFDYVERIHNDFPVFISVSCLEIRQWDIKTIKNITASL